MVRFWEYCSTVGGYWQFWVAISFMAERVIERFFPRLWIRVEDGFPFDRRRRLFIFIAVVAFVYANFRAFDYERSANDILRTQIHHKMPDFRSLT
jgi:hypothetical protein